MIFAALAVLGGMTGGIALSGMARASGPAIGVSPQCRVPDSLMDTRHSLPATTARLGAGQPLSIVAIGSSSTAGAGASHPGASYPARLNAELQRRFPDSSVTVVNRGVGGETARRMLERFDRDVIALKPHLVIWQIGTNSAMRDHDPAQFRQVIARGIRILQSAGADVILMAPQFAPRFNDTPNRLSFVQAINEAADQTNTVLFPRHAIMKLWIESGRHDFKAILSPDGLHLNDFSYDCIAQLLTEQIDNIVRPRLKTRSAR